MVANQWSEDLVIHEVRKAGDRCSRKRKEISVAEVNFKPWSEQVSAREERIRKTGAPSKKSCLDTHHARDKQEGHRAVLQ